MTEDEMKKYILDHMARHKVPKYIDFVDSFPDERGGQDTEIQDARRMPWSVTAPEGGGIETA